MPGGIGPVDSDCAKALCLTRREVSLPASADELRIFYNLGMHRVHYFPRRSAVYYVESRHVPVQEIIFTTLGQSSHSVVITQLYIDQLGYFKIGKRATLAADQAATALVALRLKGVQVSVS